MNTRLQRALAVTFSILIVTATITPAAATLEPPAAQPQHDDTLLETLTAFDSLPVILGNGNGNGNGKGKPTSTATAPTSPPGTTTTTTSPPGGPPTTTQKTTKRDPPGNKTGGPPGNKTQGPPGNKTRGPPENKSRGPPGNKTRGPPENRGGGPPEERGPPEWTKNPETPPSVVNNRSALANRSKPLADASVNVTIHDDASAADYRLAAIDALQRAEFAGPGRAVERHRTAALKALNESLPYVLDANRTTSAALFEHDKEASTPRWFAPNVSRLLVHSDAQLAATAITDAQRVRKTLRARNVSFDESAVQENITAAQAAVERAKEFREREQYHTAISQYRVAWIHAQQALDLLDLATTPNVTITTRGDLPHEGNITHAVRGRVFDVRGHELTAVVSQNGTNRTLDLSVNATPETTPGAVATFATNLTFAQQVTTIEVRATDPNRRWAPDYPDVNATVGRDRLRLDADGLPDTYEESVTGTDPLHPDSNATRTPQNESANNITDGREDFDRDGETVYEAYRFDLDPFDNDTDGDHLEDGFELRFQGLNPATNDTDNDTVADSAEDLDNDTLSNLGEQNASTNPLRADTDIDQLNDSEEVANGTDPLAADTDSDGLLDPDEYEVGTDPTVADTDGDGVLDGNETFSTSKTDNKTGISVNVTGEGNVASTLSINNSTEPLVQTDSVRNVSASAAYDFEAGANFSSANITLPYNESRVSDTNESSLQAYRYNETLQTLVPVNNSTIDTRNDTVTAETAHFSTYTVLSTEKWDAQFNESLPSKWSDSDNFSDLDRWEKDGNVSTGTITDVEVSLVGGSDRVDSDEDSTAVVGSRYRDTERNWSIPKDDKMTDGDETTTTITTTTTTAADRSGTTTTGTVSSNDHCVMSWCDHETTTTTETTTETTTTEEDDTTQDPYEDSDDDGTYDRNDDCVSNPGLGDDGCPQHSDDDGIKDYNDECNGREGYGDGCPTHSDDDTVSDYNDDCPNTPGLGEDGCTIHSDNDDENDYNDDCPEEPGMGADGCPIDDDGDDTRNFYDDCPEFPGWKPNGCPRESSLERTVTLRDAETVTLGTIAKAEAVSNRSVAQLIVVGPDGQRLEVYGEENTDATTTDDELVRTQGILPGGENDAHGDFEAVEYDLSQFAGEQVTIKVKTVGRATFEINALKIGYDTDGDTIYDAIERPSCGLRDGSGQCLDTSPYLSDTDGDGLSDAEEIGERKKVHGHVYEELHSNPTVRDTDHDGLNDAQELRGSFQMAVTQTAEASRKYLNGGSPADKREHLHTESVSSDPLKYDTDDDGLNDRQEWLYKTNPRNKDSDTDGRLDGRERAVGEDPTLHDYRGPNIRPKRYGYIFNYSALHIKYVVEYFAFDPSGVARTKVTKNGGTRYRASPNAMFSRHDGSFTGTAEVIMGGGSLTGTTVKVVATDSHGNRESLTAIQRSNDCGQAAKRWTRSYEYFTESAVRGYGVCSGFQASIGSSLQSIVDLINNPEQIIPNLVTIFKLLDKSGLLDMFIDMFISSMETKQKTNNPFAEGTEKYSEYRRAWYAGYATAFIGKALYGGSATKAVKSTKYAEKIEDFAKATRAGKTAMRIKAPYDRGKARVATGLAKAGGKAAGPILRRAKSAGAAYRVWKLQRKAEVDTAELSNVEKDRLTRFLARHGEDGAEYLRKLDNEDVEALFRRACSTGGYGTQRKIGGGDCTDLTEGEQRLFSDAVESADVDESRFVNRIEATDVSDGSAHRTFARTGRHGVEMASKLDDEALNRFVQLDTRSKRALVIAWRTTESNIDRHDIEQVLVKSDWVSAPDISVHRVGGQRMVISGDVDSGNLAVSGRFHADGSTSVKEVLSSNEEKVEEVFKDKGAGDLYDEYGVNAINHLDEIDEDTAYKIRGDLGEEILQARLMSNKYGRGSFDYDASTDSASLDDGYIPKEDIPYDFGSGQTGFDGLAIDNGNLVVIETKVKNTNGNVIRKHLGDSNNGEQLSEDWIQEKFRELGRDANTAEKRAFLEALEDQEIIDTVTNGDSIDIVVHHNEIRTEFVEYQDAPVSSNLANADSLRSPNDPTLPTVDRVEVVKIGETFIIGES